jgi:hypothetical protein
MSPRLGRARLKVVIGLAALVTGMLGGALALFEPAAQASVNLSCPQGTSEYKVDGNPLQGLSNGESAQFTVSGVTFTITKVAGADPFVDDTFDFTSTIAVSTVFVKGGLPTNVYDYDPAVTSGSGLHPPLNGGGEAPAISHLVFCIGTPGTTTTTAPSTSTSTTVPQTTTSTTVPQTTTSTTVPQTTTSTTVPQTTTSTTVPQTTTTTVPEETTTTTVPESTTTTVPEETTTTTVPEETTTSTTVVHGSTTIVTTSTDPTTTTVHEQGSTVPSSTTPRTVAPTGTLPFTGSGSAVAAMFGILCIAAGALLLASKRTRSHS